jgi:hypothetical protein
MPAIRAMARPQASLIQRFGSGGPPVERLPRTIVPASAPATKKIQSTASVRMDMGSASGNCSRKMNMPLAGSLTTRSAMPLPLVWSR